LTIGTLP
ncbi:hypothetical protein D046_6846B, partial [Vibrio parahaemolyticus V-223/04]